jgi:branched-chain amino acid transport system substrate-binding protein
MNLSLTRKATAIAVASLAVLASAACGDKSGSGGGGGTSTILIGHMAEMTGAGSSVGIPQANAIQLAVDQINAAGGFDVGGTKYTVKLQTEDDKSDATAGVTALQKMRSNGAKFVVGTTSSAVLGAYLPIIKTDQNFITVIAGAAAVGVTDNVSVYRPRVTLTQYTQATVNYLKKNNVTNIAMLTDSQHAGYVAETPHYKGLLGQNGITVKSEGSWKLGDTDFSAQLTTAIKGSPAVLNLRGYPADVARIVKQARELGFAGPIYTNTGFGTKEISDAQAQSAMKDVFDIVAPTSVDLAQNPDLATNAKAFNDAYKAKYGTDPGFTSGSAYTGVQILVAAMQKAGTTTDVPKIRDALDALKLADVKNVVDSIQPAPGDLIFTKHQASYEMVVRTYANGDFHAEAFVAGV